VDFCARVRSGRGDLPQEPGTERDVREPSIWRARAPIPIYGSIARMERSEPLAGASRRPSTVPDIDPQAGDCSGAGRADIAKGMTDSVQGTILIGPARPHGISMS
jgi:hypothetical protein